VTPYIIYYPPLAWVMNVVADNASPSLTVPVLAFAGVLVAALATYFGTKLTRSGKIANTDAAQLWEESKAMRGELRDEVRRLTDENRNCKERIEVLETENEQLKARVGTLESENGVLKRRIMILEEHDDKQ